MADIITNSWGNATDDITLLGEDVVQFYQQFSTGITVNFSSGDAGDETSGGADGTSLSSPLLAGVVAVASQAAHHKLGFVNPAY